MVLAIPQGRRDGVVTEFPSLRCRALLAGLALVSKQVRRMAMAATTPFTIGVGPACTDGGCGMVSRGAGEGTLPMSPVAAPGLAARSAASCTAAR